MVLGKSAALCIRPCAHPGRWGRGLVSRTVSTIAGAVRRAGPILSEFVASCVTFGAAAFAGLLVLLGLFWLGIAGGIDILFYRGVLLCALAFVVTIVLVAWIGRRCRRVSPREAIAAGFLS